MESSTSWKRETTWSLNLKEQGPYYPMQSNQRENQKGCKEMNSKEPRLNSIPTSSSSTKRIIYKVHILCSCGFQQGKAPQARKEKSIGAVISKSKKSTESHHQSIKA
jgi:hypothetical protein